MAFNTKSIIKDLNQKPVPQYFNTVNDVYEVLQGANGANKVTLYTAAGTAIDLATLIASIVTAVNTTGTTQLRAGTNAIGKVEVTSNALPTGAATLVKQDAIITAINTTGTTQLRTGTNSIGKIVISADERDLRNLAANKPLASAVTPGTTYWSIDTDPHANAIELSDGTTWVVI